MQRPLQVRDFDVLRREFHVKRTLSEVSGKLHEGAPKTKSSVRRVPVPEWLVKELEPLMAGKGPGDPLLVSPNGGPLRLGNWRTRVFDPALVRAGLRGSVAEVDSGVFRAVWEASDGVSLSRDFTSERAAIAHVIRSSPVTLRPHDLRHTCASLHIKHGTPPKHLSEMLGHASVMITLDLYGHLYPGDVALYVDKLGEAALEARAKAREAGMRQEGSDRVVLLPQASAGNGA